MRVSLGPRSRASRRLIERHAASGAARSANTSVRAYILIEADQTRVEELRDTLPEIKLDGSHVVSVSVVSGPYDLIATVESSDLAQLGR